MDLKKSILFIGSLMVLVFTYQWYKAEQKNENPSYEPFVAITSAILTSLSYFYNLKEKKENEKEIEQGEFVNQNIEKITHKGKGDIVVGDKIINK